MRPCLVWLLSSALVAAALPTTPDQPRAGAREQQLNNRSSEPALHMLSPLIARGVRLDEVLERSRVVDCNPAGLYFVNRDMVGRTDPITLNATATISSICPPGAVAGFVANTLKFWKNVAVCQYPNGSLWKDDRQTAVIGPGCHAIEWLGPPGVPGRFLWCRAAATKAECVPVLPPRPVPGPTPAPPGPGPAPVPFGPLYDPLPRTGVTFFSTDVALQGLVAHAADMATRNIKLFRRLSADSNFSVMEEGAQYHAAWLETQPMAGGMYATRNARIGLNNILVFMRAQQPDGFIPGQVSADPVQDAGAFVANPAGAATTSVATGDQRDGVMQGLFFASPAADMAWYLQLADVENNSSGYIAELMQVLDGYDRWLWATRNGSAICQPNSVGCAAGSSYTRQGGSNATACCRGDAAAAPKRGLLWSDGIGDSGEDSSTRFCKVANHSVPYAPCVVSYAFPIQSADVTSYSYDCRATLARLANMTGDSVAAQSWGAKAAAVAKNLKVQLWDKKAGAMFARDAADEVITTSESLLKLTRGRR